MTTSQFMMTCTPLLLAALIGAAEVPVKVFEEEFDRYAEHPEVFSENSHIEEEPGSVKRMNFTPEKQEALRKTPFAVPDDPVNFDFNFDFRFAADSKREFTVQLFMADPENPQAAPSVLDMRITEKGSSVSTLAGHNGMDWNPGHDGPLPGFPDYFMHKARLEVRDGYARLYVQREGKWYLESQRQILKKNMTLTGFNVLAASQVTLDSIQVWKHPSDAKSPAFQKEFAFDGKEAEFEVADLPYPAQYQMQFLDEKESRTQVTFRSVPEKKYIHVTRKDGKTAYDRSQFLPDAGFQVTVPGAKAKEVRTRPNLARYTNEGIAEMAAKWESFPAASKTPLHIRLKQTEPGVCELWINEKMAFPVKTEAELKKIVFQMPGGTLRPLALRQIPASKEFQVVDPAASLNWSKLWADPAMNRLAKYSEVCGVPFLSAKEYSFPLSVCEENKGNYWLECDGYLERQAFDAMPSSVHFSVPAAQYVKAYALCSVDPKATPDMVPEVTARLTNYSRHNGGRGNGFSHHTVRLPAKPGDPLPPNVKIAGGTKENPVYFVEFNIDAGAIEDIIFREGNTTLDFEFLGRLHEKDNFYQNRAPKPSLT
ncbi:MAG: hypothetical protein II715_05470, partial [Clostridia bacterium]|nr:hypothetical protein [Clostridia bacterium]